MYAIYGNIYHQYTPVMLAYIPAPWILWVLIAWAYCSQFAFGGCASLPLARCHRTVIGLSSYVIVVQAQEPTDGFRDWHASTALPIIACPQQSQPCSARHLAAMIWAIVCSTHYATIWQAWQAANNEKN